MSTYVREKVLRIPVEKLHWDFVDELDDWEIDIKEKFPGLFDYGTKDKFQFAPTEESYVDFVLEREWDVDGEYGKTRSLTEREKAKYHPVFAQIDPDVDMNFVRLVEFCWYNCSEAPNYYDHMNDSFYDEV